MILVSKRYRYLSLPLKPLPSYLFPNAFSTLCVPPPDSLSVEWLLMLFINDGAEIQSCSHPSSPPQLAVSKHNLFQPHCSHSALAQASHFWECTCAHTDTSKPPYTFTHTLACTQTHTISSSWHTKPPSLWQAT